MKANFGLSKKISRDQYLRANYGRRQHSIAWLYYVLLFDLVLVAFSLFQCHYSDLLMSKKSHLKKSCCQRRTTLFTFYQIKRGLMPMLRNGKKEVTSFIRYNRLQETSTLQEHQSTPQTTPQPTTTHHNTTPNHTTPHHTTTHHTTPHHTLTVTSHQHAP
jgi:hypothetical protein